MIPIFIYNMIPKINFVTFGGTCFVAKNMKVGENDITLSTVI